MAISAKFFQEMIDLWLAMAPYILLGMIIAGGLHLFLGKDFIARHLGKGGLASVVKATILGVPLPVCSCGVIPLASALRKDGAHKSSVLAFLVSTPTTGIDSIFATYSLLGPLFALFRPLAAVISGITLGLLDYTFEGRHQKDASVVEHKHRSISRNFTIKEFINYAFREIPADIGRWLVYGTLIGAAISAVIPGDIFSRYLVFPWDFVVAVAVGIPLYVCATGSIPIAASLMMKGLSPGAALVFLITGPATNVVTLSFVRATMGRRSFYLYLGNIIITAVMLGLIFNRLWGFFQINMSTMTHAAGEMLPMWFKVFCGSALALLIVPHFFKPPACSTEHHHESGEFDYEIKVPDIHCDHCRMVLEDRLRGSGVEKVKVDVAAKLIRVKGSISRDELIERIRSAGYNP